VCNRVIEEVFARYERLVLLSGCRLYLHKFEIRSGKPPSISLAKLDPRILCVKALKASRKAILLTHSGVSAHDLHTEEELWPAMFRTVSGTYLQYLQSCIAILIVSIKRSCRNPKSSKVT
jgi:hypothetical protein